jgi:hypothetical protein
MLYKRVYNREKILETVSKENFVKEQSLPNEECTESWQNFVQ